MLLLGNALHANIPLDALGSGVLGLLMTLVAQDQGWPAPVGGSGQLSAALVRRVQAAGARIECNQNVSRVHVRDGRATGVSTTDGRTVTVRRAVLADATVLRHAAPRRGPGRTVARPHPLRLGSAGGEDQLCAGLPDPVARQGVTRRGHRPSGRLRSRPHSLDGRREHPHRAGAALHAARLRPPPRTRPDRLPAPKVCGPTRIYRATCTTTFWPSSWGDRWIASSNNMHRASTRTLSDGSCNAPPICRRTTPICTTARSTAGPRNCSSC